MVEKLQALPKLLDQLVGQLVINPTCLFSVLWFHTLLKTLILFVLGCPEVCH